MCISYIIFKYIGISIQKIKVYITASSFPHSMSIQLFIFSSLSGILKDLKSIHPISVSSQFQTPLENSWYFIVLSGIISHLLLWTLGF